MHRRALSARGVVVIALGVLVALPVLAAPATADYVYNPYGRWNGKKVYLSPARHSDTGGRGECRGRSENWMAYKTAWHAANGRYYGDRYDPHSAYRNLRARGYKVRVGTGTVSSAIRNSNAWGAQVHIPIHSNADRRNACGRTNHRRFGTVVIYKSYGSGGGQGLAGLMVRRVGPASPGARDYSCHNSSSCTRYRCLGELCNTRAKAAYLEADFHTWNPGVDFVDRGYWWSWRLGWTVDKFLGYPR